LVIEGSPLHISPPTAALGNDRICLEIVLELINNSTAAIQVMVSGIARHAPLVEGSGPVTLTMAAGSKHDVTLCCPLDRESPGVVSYRVIVLHGAAAEFFALKYVLEPSDKEVLSLSQAV
jgi:hypothetical protein